MSTLKIKIIELSEKFKRKLIEFFLLDNSISNLSNKMKMFCILSVRFDEIYDGIKNPKRFKVCIIVCIVMWLVTLWYLLLIILPCLWSLIDNPYLPDHFKTCLFVGVLLLLLCAIEKTDYVWSELKNIDTFKFFYFLAVNLKTRHQLNDKHYKRLAISSRIIITILVYYGAATATVFLTLIFLIIGIFAFINCGHLFWSIHTFVMTAFYMQIFITLSITGSILFIYFYYFKYYFKLRFDQLNHQIKLVIPDGYVINKRREKIFYKLINQHNKLSLEILKVNLVFRRSVASFFVCLSFIKIISIYL